MKTNQESMEITDDKLLKIALVTSLIGIIGLIAFTPSIEVKHVAIKDINRGMIDEEVRIDGVITEVAQSSSKTSYFLTINDGEAQIQLVIFESQVSEIQNRNLDIEDFKNHKVQVVGTVTQYNSEMELILSSGDSLRIVS
jgi:DNA/RNA endonuclease YhcR with UshA esterase domain